MGDPGLEHVGIRSRGATQGGASRGAPRRKEGLGLPLTRGAGPWARAPARRHHFPRLCVLGHLHRTVKSLESENPVSGSGFARCPHGVVSRTVSLLGPALAQLLEPEGKGEPWSSLPVGLMFLYHGPFALVNF